MSLTYTQVLDTVNEARNTLALADHVVRDTLPLIVGRLRVAGCSAYYLKQLKHELRDFNAVTGEWKEQK